MSLVGWCVVGIYTAFTVVCILGAIWAELHRDRS